MTRAQLEHVIRAAGVIANVEDIIVVGSQAPVRHAMIPRDILEQRLASTDVDAQTRSRVSERIQVHFGV